MLDLPLDIDPLGDIFIYAKRIYPHQDNLPQESHANVHCDPLWPNIVNGDMSGGRWLVGSGFVPPLNPVPRLFYKGQFRCEKVIDLRSCLLCSPLSIPVQDYLDFLAQRYGSRLVLRRGPAEGNLIFHGSPGLHLNQQCFTSLCPLVFGYSTPRICEYYILPCWNFVGGDKGV